jgi:hypothetical protein
LEWWTGNGHVHYRKKKSNPNMNPGNVQDLMPCCCSSLRGFKGEGKAPQLWVVGRGEIGGAMRKWGIREERV